MIRLEYPFDEKTVCALKAGDAVSISGRVYTGRDKFHKYLADSGFLSGKRRLVDSSEPDFRDGALYHCGPVVVPVDAVYRPRPSCADDAACRPRPSCADDAACRPRPSCADDAACRPRLQKWRVVSAGPTTSVRENAYEPDFIARSGVRLIIGKGGMDEKTLAAMKKYGCVYIQAVGGAGALYGAAVKNVAGVSHLEDFGAAEAVWHFDVSDFTGIVAMDAHGRSLFAEVAAASAKQM